MFEIEYREDRPAGWVSWGKVPARARPRGVEDPFCGGMVWKESVNPGAVSKVMEERKGARPTGVPFAKTVASVTRKFSTLTGTLAGEAGVLERTQEAPVRAAVPWEACTSSTASPPQSPT